MEPLSLFKDIIYGGVKQGGLESVDCGIRKGKKKVNLMKNIFSSVIL
jgi:hypothetical protein